MKNLVFLFSLTFVACASVPETQTLSDRTPDWVTHPERDFPNTRYLVAVGNGGNRDEAIRDAKKQMAESFLVKVESTTKVDAQSGLSEDTRGQVSGDSKQTVSKQIQLETSTHLRGAEVKQVSTVGDQTYALLALDKLSARSGLLLEATQIQNQMNAQLDSLEQNFTQAGLQSAQEAYRKLQGLYGEASALGMSALIDVNSNQTRLNRIVNESRAKHEKIAFVVTTLKGENYFEQDIQACINDRGGSVFSVDQAPSGASKIQITVVERPQQMTIEGWTKIRFDLTAAVIQASGKLYRIQASETETGRNRSAVLESVSDKLSAKLCDQLFNRVGEMK